MEQTEQPDEITALIKAAEEGDADAQFELGQKYKDGDVVESNIHRATEWYLKAAEQDHAQSQFTLGELYRRGDVLEQNNKMAYHWYSKAAENGNANAQYLFGVMHQIGKGTEKNDKKAAYWFRKAAAQGHADAQCDLGWMYDYGYGVKRSLSKAVRFYHLAAENGSAIAQYNLGLCYKNGLLVEQDNAKALNFFQKAANSTDNEVRFEAIEMQDEIERIILSRPITTIRTKILKLLKVNNDNISFMTHYTSLQAGTNILFKASPLRLGHISSFNDPNEGKLLWNYFGHVPLEKKPVFVGCFLPHDDSLNMWRFYSKNQNNDDACGCAITFTTKDFFSFSLLKEPTISKQKTELKLGFSDTGKSPQESATFYRIVYVNEDMSIYDNDETDTLKDLFSELKIEINKFLGKSPSDEKLQQASRLMGPLPYLIKDADYKSEEEHRIIVTHLEYGSSEIQTQEPTLENEIPKSTPKLFLELNRAEHLDAIKHITLGPKAPYKEMMAPYWHHKLANDFPEQIKNKIDFYVRASKCAYK
ncbi:tetratricopeptide repeat protein [Aeromonas sp. SG16]|uniref:tetratricopeptide repeat protein n=1 Tax=Aeromonas sp. SG16 TaxID=2950548 RepID=UPI00210EFB4D|nr:tetratricopeptide repeat protein [Aeromonas sp. SG16]MCQ4053353.1 sel1 repeat family protein [Aeromonas sp. SG16]